jgi:tetratricopeptide (TPR) repeat protein
MTRRSSGAKMRAEVDREGLKRWLRDWLSRASENAVDDAALDLDAFVELSSGFGGVAGERLRLLAIYLEEDEGCGWSDAATNWPMLRRIYDAARRASPRDLTILKSTAITALRFVQAGGRTGKAEKVAWRDALEAIDEALQLDATDAEAWRLLGDVNYWGHDALLTEALTAYERALTLEPHDGWAQLYRAHALHDLARWDEAASAYAQVEPSSFTAEVAWRLVLAKEQRATCLLRAGRRDEALVEFEAAISAREEALDHPESEEAFGLHEPPQLIVEAVDALPEIAARVRRLLRRERSRGLLR